MGRVRAALEYLRLDRLDGHDERIRQFLLEDLSRTGDRAARADAGDDGVDLAAGVFEDLLRRRLAVDLEVGGVVELLRQPGAGCLSRVLLGSALRFLDAHRSRREDQLRAEGLQELASLDGHRVGHDQRAFVAARGCDEGQSDPGVAARRLDDRVARLQLARLLRLHHHRDGDAVLDRRERVERLELDHDLRAAALLRDLVQPDQRRVSDQLRDVVVDLSVGHCRLLIPFATKTKTRDMRPGPIESRSCENARYAVIAVRSNGPCDVQQQARVLMGW